MACVIRRCTSHSGRNKPTAGTERITFHTFPKDEELRNEWIKFVNRKNWVWKKHSRLCSKHFTPDSFVYETNSKRRWLKDGALPTLKDGALATLYSTDSDPWEDASVPMNVYDAVKIEISEECVGTISAREKRMGMVVTPTPEYITSAGPATAGIQHEPAISRAKQHNIDIGVTLDSQILNNPAKSRCGTKKPFNTSTDSERDQHGKTIVKLQRQLEREKKVSRRRLRKINTLTKRVSRLEKKTNELYTILLNRQENNESGPCIIIKDGIIVS